MADSTELIITTPNAFGFKGFLHSMMRREKVHEDHNYYLSHRTIKQLCEKNGLKWKEIYYYQEVVGTGLARVLDTVLNMMTKLSPVLADGIVVRVMAAKIKAVRERAQIFLITFSDDFLCPESSIS